MAGENSVFVNDRTIVFSGPINSESVGKIMLTIKVIEDDDNDRAAHLKNYERKPINLNISTGGGSVYDTFALIDMIESCKTPVYTYGYGQVMSAGLFLFLAGHKRFCGKHTTFMYHESSTRMDDYGTVLTSRVIELNRIESTLDNMLTSKTKVTEKMIKKWYETREVYLSSEDALKLGIVNAVL